LDPSLFDDDDDEEDEAEVDRRSMYLHRITKLATIRKAIANFVSIISGKNIPVRFNSGVDSYTTGDIVVISADTDPNKFDPMVGLALHEGSHVLLTDFTFLKTLDSIIRQMKYGRVPMTWSPEYKNAVDVHYCPSTTNVLEQILPSSLYNTLNIKNDPYGIAWPETANFLFKNILFICNIIEDRRIDKYVYQNAMGYRPYYDALYQKYHFTKSIGDSLKYDPEWRTLTINNYVNRILLFFHPEADMDALPGLRDIINEIDFNNVDRISPDTVQMVDNPSKRTFASNSPKIPLWASKVPTFEETPALWQLGCRTMEHILKYVALGKMHDEKPPTGDITNSSVTPFDKNNPDNNLDLSGLNMDGLGDSPEDFSPRDVERDKKVKGSAEKGPGPVNTSRAKKDLNSIRELVNGGTPKKKLPKREEEAVQALESANATLEDVSGHGITTGSCMVIRRVTPQVLDQPWFIFKRSQTPSGVKESIKKGTRMGQILLHKLQIRNDPLITRTTRQSAGGIDRRLLSQLGMDIENVFYKSRTDIHKPAMLHLTIDASGSMGGGKWNRVVQVAVAIAYIGSKMKNVDVVVSIRGGDTIPMVAIVFDSRKDHFNSFTKILSNIGVSGTTPEGLCFKATMKIILDSITTHDVYFINFSDGEPIFNMKVQKGIDYSDPSELASATYRGYSYTGELAINHTRSMVNLMKESGVKVLSYFIGYDDNKYTMQSFRRMYGEDATFVNVESAMDVLKTLNKRLSVRGG
jgi:hypothetical protein